MVSSPDGLAKIRKELELRGLPHGVSQVKAAADKAMEMVEGAGDGTAANPLSRKAEPGLQAVLDAVFEYVYAPKGSVKTPSEMKQERRSAAEKKAAAKKKRAEAREKTHGARPLRLPLDRR